MRGMRKPSISPVRWTPPPPVPRSSVCRPLPPITRLPLPACGEDVAVDASGRLLTGLADGRIVRLTQGTLETIAHTGGRPLGVEVAPDGALIVCDAARGLLRVTLPEGAIEVLADRARHGVALCNNAAIAGEGTIYFSDSSQRFPVEHWRADLVEHSGTGRLLARTPDGTVRVLLDGLQFANGVALAPDESFVAVGETGGYVLRRYWLTGARKGTSDVLCELPGFVDNLATDPERGLIWAAIATPRNPALDWLHRTHPLVRRMIWRLPERLQPQPDPTLCLLAVDAAGEVVHELVGRSPAFRLPTGVRAVGRTLYVASLEERALGKLTLP